VKVCVRVVWVHAAQGLFFLVCKGVSLWIKHVHCLEL
jgi:hypothetical protein